MKNAFLCFVALIFIGIGAPHAHAQQTAKVLSACGSAGYTAGTVNYETMDTGGGSCPGGSGGVTPTPGTASGCTPAGYQSTASTNSTSAKGSAGLLCGGIAINTTGTIYYLRLYDSASAPTCSSATGFVTSIPIPASAAGAGTQLSFGSYGVNFLAGIAWCITGGGSSTDNTNAATGIFVSYGFK